MYEAVQGLLGREDWDQMRRIPLVQASAVPLPSLPGQILLCAGRGSCWRAEGGGQGRRSYVLKARRCLSECVEACQVQWHMCC